MEELRRAIEQEDDALVLELDERVAWDFYAILDTSVSDLDELRLLFGFLINQLVPTEDRTNLQQRIVDRLNSLHNKQF